MELYPAVIVHGLDDAIAALSRAAAVDASVTLLSAPGAALYAGCGWWLALVKVARETNQNVPCIDLLDCADGTGRAFEALRIGLPRLVLWPTAPGRDAVVAIAEARGGFVLAAAPLTEAGLRHFSGAARGECSVPAVRENGDKSGEPG